MSRDDGRRESANAFDMPTGTPRRCRRATRKTATTAASQPHVILIISIGMQRSMCGVLGE
jgi:hypothetical protein